MAVNYIWSIAICFQTIFKKAHPYKSMSHSSGLNSAVDVQVIVTDGRDTDVDKVEHQRPAYVAVGLILAMTATTVLLPLLLTSRLFGLNESLDQGKNVPCMDPCRWVDLDYSN